MMDSTTVIITTTDNRVLLQKRDENPDIEYSGYYSLVSGYLEEEETPLDGIIRELKEEFEHKKSQKVHFSSITYLGSEYRADYDRWEYIHHTYLMDNAADIRILEGESFVLLDMDECLRLEKWPLELFSRLLPRIYQITEEINRRFQNEIQAKYPDNQDKVKSMAIIYDGQVKMAHLAIAAGFSVNGVARLHTEILKHQELKDFYEMMPEKFNNKTNGITQRRFLLHGNPKLAAWVTDKIGDEWITDLSKIDKLSVFVDDKKAQQEFMNIKFQNKVRLAKYIKEHNGVEVDPHSIFDVQDSFF